MWHRLAASAIFFLALGAAPGAFGQDDPNDPLRKFEKSVKAPPGQQPAAAPAPAPAPRQTDNGYRHDQQSGDLGDELVGDIANVILDAAGQMGALTFQRLTSEADDSVRREPGDILIPFVRYDFFRQSVNASIYANDNRIEAGFGPIAVLLEEYIFHNRATGSGLTIDRQMFLYRMSPSKDFEFDLGLGQTTLAGVERTPLGSFSIPAKLRVAEGVVVEFIPTWSGIMSDYEAALHWGMQYGSLKVGYRYLSTPTANLKGPYAGFALYF